MPISVSTSAELMAALSSATAGTTILLASGNYGDLALSGSKQPWAQFAGEVTIKSADATHPATFSSVNLDGVKNLSFDTVKFDYVSATGAPVSTINTNIANSSNITIQNSIFDGDLAHGVGGGLDGYGAGRALFVSGSSGIVINNSNFFNWQVGAAFVQSNNITVTNNNIHNISGDGMEFVQENNVLIQGNYIHDFNVPANGLHPDMIQFWTTGTTAPSTNIKIEGNFLDSGAGTWTQSIFMRNEMVDQGQAGQSMYYKNVTIDNNVIYNAMTHGITVGETIGLTINNNTILQNKASVPTDYPGQGPTSGLWIPTIHLADASQNVVIDNNILPTAYNPQLSSATGQRSISGNFFVQNTDPHGSNYVGALFVNGLVGSTATLADLHGVLGGAIDTTNVGSSLTQPDSGGLGSSVPTPPTVTPPTVTPPTVTPPTVTPPTVTPPPTVIPPPTQSGQGSGHTSNGQGSGHHKAAHHSHGHNSPGNNSQVSSSQAGSSQAVVQDAQHSSADPHLAKLVGPVDHAAFSSLATSHAVQELVDLMISTHGHG